MIVFKKFPFQSDRFPYVERIWMLKNTGARQEVSLVSDGYPEIVFTRRGKIYLHEPWGIESLSTVGVIGNRGEMIVSSMEKHTAAISVKIKPWALPYFIQDNAKILKDRIGKLQDFVSVDDSMRESTLDLSINHEDFIETFVKPFLEQLSAHPKKAVPLLEESIRNLFDRSRGLKFHQKKSLNCSQRYLEKKYKEYVGFSPNTYERIIKIKCASLLMANGQFDKIADLAANLGYFDHSHFNKDFVRLVKTHPTAFIESIDQRPLLNNPEYLNQYVYH